MRLFTPVSEDTAADLVGGLRAGDALHWQTAVVPEEAEPDAVWVTVEVSEQTIIAFEQPHQPSPGYREFLLLPELLIGCRIVVASAAAD